MNSIEIQASNIKCGGCVSNIENGLNQLTNVAAVKVDITSNKVMVEGKDLEKEVITAKLAELGYPAV